MTESRHGDFSSSLSLSPLERFSVCSFLVSQWSIKNIIDLMTNSKNWKPWAFYLHVSKHGWEIVRAGAEAEVVEDVFLHCCYVGIAKPHQVTVPKQERRQFIEPASSGQLDHWGALCRRGTRNPAAGQPQPTEASAPSQFPPLLPFTPSSLPGFGGWSDRTHKSPEWYKDQNASSLHIECSQLPPNSSSLNICGFVLEIIYLSQEICMEIKGKNGL